MTTQRSPTWQSPRWQDSLADLVTSPEELFELLELDKALLPAARAATQQFPLRATRAYVSRIEPGNPDDPLLRQILPLGEELIASTGYSADPLGETAVNPLSGVIHKYRGRLLFVVASQCAINCRYCFRRHFPYGENTPGRQQWEQALDYIRAHEDIIEVIYSGGDPLVLGDRQLRWLTHAIADIPHVRRLRVHTRLPIVAPTRVTESCLQWLTETRLRAVLVIHSNHARELDEEVVAALQRLRTAGVTLLNQTVLLRGVNDCAPTLAALNEALFDAGVLPYYLHLLDKVIGAAHFAVSDAHASRIYQTLLTLQSGYLVPRMVREHAGAASKTPVL